MSGWSSRWRGRHAVIATAILALASLLFAFSPSVSVGAQIATLTVGVAVLGLPHGALDLHMLRREMKRRIVLWQAVALVAAYMLVALIVLALWHLEPRAALFAFLAVSALHFGHIDDAADWRGRGDLGRALQVLGRGAVPIVVPSFFRAAETTSIYNWLLGPEHALASYDVQRLAAVGLVLLPFAVVPEITRFARFPATGSRALRDLTAVLASASLFVFVPPLLAFALYFCVWHSIAHTIDLAAQLDETSPVRGFRRFASAAALPTGATLVAFIAAGIWVSAQAAPTEAAARVVFIGLSCLTAPHLLVSTWTTRVRAFSRRRQPRILTVQF